LDKKFKFVNFFHLNKLNYHQTKKVFKYQLIINNSKISIDVLVNLK